MNLKQYKIARAPCGKCTNAYNTKKLIILITKIYANDNNPVSCKNLSAIITNEAKNTSALMGILVPNSIPTL